MLHEGNLCQKVGRRNKLSWEQGTSCGDDVPAAELRPTAGTSRRGRWTLVVLGQVVHQVASGDVHGEGAGRQGRGAASAVHGHLLEGIGVASHAGEVFRSQVYVDVFGPVRLIAPATEASHRRVGAIGAGSPAVSISLGHRPCSRCTRGSRRESEAECPPSLPTRPSGRRTGARSEVRWGSGGASLNLLLVVAQPGQ